MENPFDQIALDQQKARTEADGYRFFINAGFVKELEEIKRLYRWFDEDGQIRDRDGKTRLRLLKKIPDSELHGLIHMRKSQYMPSRLADEVLRRTTRNQ